MFDRINARSRFRRRCQTVWSLSGSGELLSSSSIKEEASLLWRPGGPCAPTREVQGASQPGVALCWAVNAPTGGVGSVIERFQLRFNWRFRRGKVLPSRGVGSQEIERSLNETLLRSGFSRDGKPCGSGAVSESPRGRVKAHQRLGEFEAA